MEEEGTERSAEYETGEDEAGEAEAVERLESPLSALGDRAAELDQETLAEADEEERAEIQRAAEELGEGESPAFRAPGVVKLSRNFVLAEFHCHDGTRVPGKALPALRRLVRQVLQPMRNRFGECTVHSGYRTDAHNASVGGAPQSQHLYHRTPKDVAADVSFASGSPSEWAAEADRLLRGGGGIGTYAGFTHVDNRPGTARWTG